MFAYLKCLILGIDYGGETTQVFNRFGWGVDQVLVSGDYKLVYYQLLGRRHLFLFAEIPQDVLGNHVVEVVLWVGRCSRLDEVLE
jgi:hypothetical protein